MNEISKSVHCLDIPLSPRSVVGSQEAWTGARGQVARCRNHPRGPNSTSPHCTIDLGACIGEPARTAGPSGRHRLFDGGHKLLERERLRQEGELSSGREVLFEGLLGITGHKDDLQIRIAPAELL